LTIRMEFVILGLYFLRRGRLFVCRPAIF